MKRDQLKALHATISWHLTISPTHPLLFHQLQVSYLQSFPYKITHLRIRILRVKGDFLQRISRQPLLLEGALLVVTMSFVARYAAPTPACWGLLAGQGPICRGEDYRCNIFSYSQSQSIVGSMERWTSRYLISGKIALFGAGFLSAHCYSTWKKGYQEHKWTEPVHSSLCLVIYMLLQLQSQCLIIKPLIVFASFFLEPNRLRDAQVSLISICKSSFCTQNKWYQWSTRQRVVHFLA